ncbi:MAG TPA: MgtC/SapB family protein [Ktedonobacterales bacterium]|nr:MgtC/SapB family protein [Ktedonobacterales bacterium]
MVTPHDLALIGSALLAGLCGFVVGWEREAHGHRAGTRTFALVTLGAAVLTALAVTSLAGAGADRVIAGIVQGIGFIGAGLILHAQTGSVKGLTTAAAVWTVTSIGIVIGAGHYIAGIALTLVILLLLWWPYVPLLARLQPRTTREEYAAKSTDSPPTT